MSPADLTPEQIADGLRALAKREGLTSVTADYIAAMGIMRWQIVECRLREGSAWHHDCRTGVADTYDAALSACRAAEFGKGAS